MTTLERMNTIVRHSKAMRTFAMVFLSLSDQVCISGARFLTTLLIARYAYTELGDYTISFGLLLISNCVLESLISGPFNLYHHRGGEEEKKSYHGSVLLILFGLAFVAALAFAGAWFEGEIHEIATGAAGETATSRLHLTYGAMAVSVPFVLLREFARRVEISRLQIGFALLVDAVAAILQLGFLVALVKFDGLSSSTAYIAMGLSSAIPAFIWLAIGYRGYSIDIADARKQFLRHWTVAKWPMFAQIAGLLHLQGTIWLIGLYLGLDAAGQFGACNYILYLINPIALGACSFVTPLAIRTYKQTGIGAVQRLIAGVALALGGLMGMISIVVSLQSDFILKLFFDKPNFVGLSVLMSLLGANMTLSVMSMILDQGIWAIERPSWLLHTTLIAAISTLVLALPLASIFGLEGAAGSLAVGRALGIFYQAYQFFISTKKTVHEESPDSSPPVRSSVSQES